MSDRYLPEGSKIPPMNACIDCGMFVWSKQIHDEWHDAQVMI